MIPKIIHYCWFGGKPLPESAKKCIASWRKFLPDYEIKRWDETNFDVNMIPYTKQAYAARKFAFVSDYARFWILYKFGGLYFDTDVEVIKSLDDIIEAGPFMGCENPYSEGSSPRNLSVAPGLGLGANPKLGLYREILDFYENTEFVTPDGKSDPETVVTYVTKIFLEKGLKNTNEMQTVAGVNIYPAEYFCPISTEDGKLRRTANTRSIHWYDQTWQSPIRKYGRKVLLVLGGPQLKKLLKQIILR